MGRQWYCRAIRWRFTTRLRSLRKGGALGCTSFREAAEFHDLLDDDPGVFLVEFPGGDFVRAGHGLVNDARGLAVVDERPVVGVGEDEQADARPGGLVVLARLAGEPGGVVNVDLGDADLRTAGQVDGLSVFVAVSHYVFAV